MILAAAACSSTLAHHPITRLAANVGVNIERGTPQVSTPGDTGFGSVLQKYLEESNVNPVTEISDLIAAQRAYEMNARIITGADEMLSATANLR